MPSKQNIFTFAGALSGALVWGLIWFPYRALQDAGVSGALATLLTSALAILFGAFMLPHAWRERRNAGWWTLWLLLSSGWANLGFVLGMLGGEVMRVLLLFYLAPLWTILFSYWLLGERLNHYGYVVMFLSICGAVVMLWKPQVGVPLPQNLAEWIGLSAGMAFALSTVVARRSSHMSLEAKTVSVWLGTIVLAAPLLWWQGGMVDQVGAIGAQQWLILAVLGVAICATSYAVQYSIARLPANRAMLLFLIELVFAAVSSYLLASEVMQPRDWVGALLIVSASLLSGKLHEPERAD
ncbi:MAG TPA: DMT family transporter [Gallionella sp.]|nr:DMT family transporter [Gallionella sp.]